MKNFKAGIAIILISFFASNVMQSQEKPKLNEDQKQQFVNQMNDNKIRLGLTPEQEKPFKEISKKYALQLKELKESESNKKDKLQQFKSIISQKNLEMKTLLSEKQYGIYLQIQEERKTKMKALRKE